MNESSRSEEAIFGHAVDLPVAERGAYLANLYAVWSKTDPTKAALATEWQQQLEAFTRGSSENAKPTSPATAEKK